MVIVKDVENIAEVYQILEDVLVVQNIGKEADFKKNKIIKQEENKMVNLFRKLKKITKQSSAPYQKNGQWYGRAGQKLKRKPKDMSYKW